MSNTTDDHTTTDSIKVTRSDESGRYELHIDGALAGVAEFVDQDEQTVFTHTEVYEDFQGRGLGSTLVGEAVRDAVARDRVIVPQCPYTARWLSTHEVPGARIAQP